MLLAFSAVPARSDHSNGLPTEFRPSFPVFGSGPVVNFLDGDNQAMTNAAAHTGFSLAIPLLGEHFWGRKGLWVTGLSWMALTVLQESLFHAPPNPDPGYPAELRSDLITRLVPCAMLLILDAIRGDGRAAIHRDMPPAHPGMPWPVEVEVPQPKDERVTSRDSRPGQELATLQTRAILIDPSLPRGSRSRGRVPPAHLHSPVQLKQMMHPLSPVPPLRRALGASSWL